MNPIVTWAHESRTTATGGDRGRAGTSAGTQTSTQTRPPGASTFNSVSARGCNRTLHINHAGTLRCVRPERCRRRAAAPGRPREEIRSRRVFSNLLCGGAIDTREGNVRLRVSSFDLDTLLSCAALSFVLFRPAGVRGGAIGLVGLLALRSGSCALSGRPGERHGLYNRSHMFSNGYYTIAPVYLSCRPRCVRSLLSSLARDRSTASPSQGAADYPRC